MLTTDLARICGRDLRPARDRVQEGSAAREAWIPLGRFDKLRRGTGEEGSEMTTLTPALIAAALGAHAGGLTLAAAVDLGPRLAVIATQKGGESHADSGRIVVRYVEKTAAGFRRSAAPEVSESRASWGAAPEWKLRRDLADAPMLVIKGGGAWQGQTCAWTALVELDIDAPREVVVALTEHSGDTGDGDYQAEIARDGMGLKLVYSGAINRTFRLRRVGGRLVSDPSLPMDC